MDADDIEGDLRLFALRQASASKDLGKRLVVKVESSNQDCPMHRHHQGPAHLSRKEMARELRILAARQEREMREMRGSRRSNSFSPSPAASYNDYTPRSQSLDPYSHAYNSIPRRGSSKTVHRHGSFQGPGPYMREKFTGRVDFKTTLRQLDPKRDERASGGRLVTGGPRYNDVYVSGVYKEPHQPPRRGTIVDSDFDFRGSSPALHNRSISPQYKVNVIQEPRRPQKLELTINDSGRELHVSPTVIKCVTNPASPKRVEFSDQMTFNFERKTVTSSGNTPKPILRQVERPLSLIEQFERQEMERRYRMQLESSSRISEPLKIDPDSRDSHKDDTNISTDSLVKIYVPPNKKDAEDSNDATISAGSDSEVTKENEAEEVPKTRQVAKRTLSADMAATSRKVPPMLSDWNRSQSFPPPSTQAGVDASNDQSDDSGAFKEGLPKKAESPMSTSNLSLNSVTSGRGISNFKKLGNGRK